MMKAFILVVTSFLFSMQITICQERSINFIEGEFSDALELAKKSEKNIFFDAYTTWCGPCKFMSKNVFTVNRVADFVNEDFVSIKVDMEKGEGIELTKKYKISAYPTFLLLDYNGNELHRIVGGSQPDDFIKKIQQGLGDNSLSNMEQRYIKGENEPSFVLEYIEGLLFAYKQKEAKQVTKKYLEGLSDTEKITLENWFLYENKRLTTYGSERFDFLLANREQFCKIVGSEKVENKLSVLFSSAIYRYLGGSREYDSEKFKSIKSQIEKVNLKSKDELFLQLNLAKLRGKKNFDAFIKLVGQHISTITPHTRQTIVYIMGFIAEEGGTKEQCLKAAKVLKDGYQETDNEDQKEYHRRVIKYLNAGPRNLKK